MSHLYLKVLDNARKPKGFLGRCVLEFMNRFAHKELAEWAIDGIEVEKNKNILDVGCGGGANIARLLKKYPLANVVGVDYSAIAVRLSQKHNSKAIKNGKCKIYKSDVRCLPFRENTFDIITAFETIYYWPDIEQSFRGIYKILSNQGVFLIANGADAEEGGWTWDRYIEGMQTYPPTEITRYLTKVGFKNIKMSRKKRTPFFCILAYKI